VNREVAARHGVVEGGVACISALFDESQAVTA